MTRYRIPEEFLHKDPADGWRLIGRAFAVWLTPLVVIAATYEAGLWPVWIAAACVAGSGLHLLALVGHEGTHFNLHPRRWVSARRGTLVSAMAPLHFNAGFAVSHALHHRYTNTERDPDVALFRPCGSVAERLLLARSRAARKYLRDTLLLALDRWPEEREIAVSLTRSQLRRLARINLLASAGVLVAYGAVFAVAPRFAAVALGLPLLFAVVISGARPYFEHAGTTIRSWVSPVFNVLFGGVNYHWAHHVSPGVPAVRLPLLHAWLCERGEAPDVERRLLPLLATLSSRRVYGRVAP